MHADDSQHEYHLFVSVVAACFQRAPHRPVLPLLASSYTPHSSAIPTNLPKLLTRTPLLITTPTSPVWRVPCPSSWPLPLPHIPSRSTRSLSCFSGRRTFFLFWFYLYHLYFCLRGHRVLLSTCVSFPLHLVPFKFRFLL